MTPEGLPHIHSRSAALQALLDEAEADMARAVKNRRPPRIPSQAHRSPVGSSVKESPASAARSVVPIGAQRMSTESARPESLAQSLTTWETPGPRRSQVTRATLGSPRTGAGRGRATKSRRATGPSRGRRGRGRQVPKRTRTSSRCHIAVAGYGLLRLGRSTRIRSAQVRRLIRGVAAPSLVAPTAWSTPPAPPAPMPPAAPRPTSRVTSVPRPAAQAAADHLPRAPLTSPDVPAHDRGRERADRAAKPDRPRRRGLLVSLAAVAAVVAAVVLIAWQLGRDRTPNPPASPVSATTPAASTPASGATAATSASAAAPARTSQVAAVRGTTRPAPTSAAAANQPAVLPIPSGPTSVRSGDRAQGTVVPGSTRLTGWIVLTTTR